MAYEALVAMVPDGLELDHLCRDRTCCNPGHLEPVTRKENCARGLRGRLHTHCPHGHALTADNAVINNRGHRYCRACSRAQYRPVAIDRRRIKKAVCKRGHLLAETASVSARTGARKCLACSNDLQRQRRARETGA